MITLKQKYQIFSLCQLLKLIYYCLNHLKPITVFLVFFISSFLSLSRSLSLTHREGRRREWNVKETKNHFITPNVLAIRPKPGRSLRNSKSRPWSVLKHSPGFGGVNFAQESICSAGRVPADELSQSARRVQIDSSRSPVAGGGNVEEEGGEREEEAKLSEWGRGGWHEGTGR